jgi:hypothetical protein
MIKRTDARNEPAFSLAVTHAGRLAPQRGAGVVREAEDSRETRIGLSAAARKAAEHLAASKATKIVRQHHALRSITQSAAELHSWNEKHPTQPFSLNVLNLSVNDVEIRE